MNPITHAFVLALSIGWSLWLNANEAAPACLPQNFTDLIRCAEKNSFEIRISDQQLQSAKKLEDTAQQWVNPELEADHMTKGSDKSETNASILFSLRMGGKRSALLDEARSEVSKAEASHKLSVQQTRLKIMLSAYRLAHLRSEIDLEEESVTTFSKIIQQFQRRPALSPEQDVSLAVFRMALADHQLRLTRLKVDQQKLAQALSLVTGVSQPLIEINLPPRRTQWPEVNSTKNIEDSSQVKQAEAELKLAHSLKSKADGESWPDIKIGPSFRAIKENGQNETFLGFGLSMPLPVFSVNSGAREYSSQKVVEAELALQQTRQKISATKAELIYRYNQTVRSLKSTLSTKTINEKHVQIERQFFKGLVSSSLVIEAHRQLYDLEEQRNASELEALEAYGQVLILEDRFFEVIL